MEKEEEVEESDPHLLALCFTQLLGGDVGTTPLHGMAELRTRKVQDVEEETVVGVVGLWMG